MKDLIMKHKLALVASVALVLLACVTVVWNQQRPGAKQQKELATLKELHDSGILTEDEYQAKVRAIESGAAPTAGGQASDGDEHGAKANDDAEDRAGGPGTQESASAEPAQEDQLTTLKELRDNGVLSEQEYQAKVRAISASQPAAQAQSGDPLQQQIESLKELRANGMLTEDEYRAKLQALTTGQNAGADAFANGMTRTVEIFDPALQMRAATLQVPADWKFAGAIDRSRGCHGTGPEAQTRAQSPDGLTAIEVYPGLAWRDTTSRTLAQIMARNGCPPVDMSTPAEFLQRIVLPNLRPNATLDRIDPLYPEDQARLEATLQKMQEDAYSQASQFQRMGLRNARPAHHTLAGVLARIHYSINGREVEETIGTRVHCADVWVPGNYVAPPSINHNCNSYPLVIFRAPRGTLDGIRPHLLAINRSYRIDQAWDFRMAQIIKQQSDAMIAASNANFQTMMKASQDAENIRTQTWQMNEQARAASVNQSIAESRAQQAAMDKSARDWTLFALDQRAYINPQNGQEYDLSNKYSYSYISSDGRYFQNNDPNFDPTKEITPGVTWNRVY